MIVTDDDEDEERRIDQPGLRPTHKIAHAALAGALTTLVIFALNRLTGGEVALPGEVGAAITAAVMSAVGFLVKERSPPALDGADGG